MAKHVSNIATVRTSGRVGRNSNVELLRIIAMFCIVLNHFPWPWQQLYSETAFVSHLFIRIITPTASLLGGLGDCLFFFISVWYLCEEKPDLKKSLRRAWILERELLFWSFTMFGVTLVVLRMHLINLPKKDFLLFTMKSVFPTITNHWWYPTSYILFLAMLPFLLVGLRKLGRLWHLRLVIVLLILFAIVPFQITRNIFRSYNMTYCVWLFVYQFSIISYFKWYQAELLRSHRFARRCLWSGIALGFIPQILYIAVAVLLHSDSSGWYLWLNCPACLPSMLIALGAITLMEQRVARHSKILNKMASGVFAVYLITTTRPTNDLIERFFAGIPQQGWLLLGICILFAIVLYIGLICIDFIRQALFSITVDRHKGRWFELLWDKYARMIQHYRTKRLSLHASQEA